MSASPASILYRSAAQTDAKPQGQQLAFFLLPDYCPIQLDAYGFEQNYSQLISSFGNSGPHPKNTKASNFGLSDANAILARYSTIRDKGAGIGDFSASFIRVPASWDDYTQVIQYPFPGFPGLIGQTGSRDPFTDAVQARIRHDYFVIDPGNVISTVSAGSPGTGSVNDSGGSAVNCVYELSDISIIAKSIFCVANSGTPDYTNRTQSLTPSGGVTVGTTIWYQTQPTKSVYQSWMSQAGSVPGTSGVGWNGIAWPGDDNAINDGSTGAGHDYTQLVAEASVIKPYFGQVVERITVYVLAK